MKEITQSEAQSALDTLNDGTTQFSIQGHPDRLCNVYVYPVRVWDGEFVDWKDVMFIRDNGKVRMYESLN
jgi:hypothetical protein